MPESKGLSAQAEMLTKEIEEDQKQLKRMKVILAELNSNMDDMQNELFELKDKDKHSKLEIREELNKTRKHLEEERLKSFSLQKGERLSSDAEKENKANIIKLSAKIDQLKDKMTGQSPEIEGKNAEITALSRQITSQSNSIREKECEISSKQQNLSDINRTLDNRKSWAKNHVIRAMDHSYHIAQKAGEEQRRGEAKAIASSSRLLSQIIRAGQGR